MKTIGDRIKAKRKELNLTQLELAEKLNVTDRAVSKWEQNEGNPDLSLVPTICEVLGVSTDYLLLGKEEEKISLDDMDETKRMHYLIKKDDGENFVKFKYTEYSWGSRSSCSMYSGCTEQIGNISFARLNKEIWNEIFENKAKNVFSVCCDALIKKFKDLNQPIDFMIRGISDNFVKMAFDLDRVDVFRLIDIKHFAHGTDQEIRGRIDDVIRYRTHSSNFHEIIKGTYATCIGLDTIRYMFENSKKSPKCFEYFTSFEMPSKGNYGHYENCYSFLESAVAEIALDYKDLKTFRKILDLFKAYANDCKVKTEGGWFHKLVDTYVMPSGSEVVEGRIFKISESWIKKLILLEERELVNECLEYNKIIIKKIMDIDGKHYEKNNRGVFLMTEPEIERYYQLNSNKLSKEEKYLMECVNGRIINPGKIRESRDLKFVRKVLDENYFNYFEYCFDAITNKKEKEFFKFCIDNELNVIADKLMITDGFDKDHHEFLMDCWNFFNSISNMKKYPLLARQNKLINADADVELKLNELIYTKILGNSHYFNGTGQKQIEECICSLKNNKLIAYIKEQKEAVYNEVVELIAKEKKEEQDKVERAKIVKGLTRDYFEKLLKDDGEELFIIKLCSLFDAIIKFDYKIEGEDFSDRMNKFFKKLESELPQSRTCDDGWGYIVDDTEWFNAKVKPARDKHEHLTNIFNRLRMQRNNISHSETHKVEELSKAELKECLEYVFSINNKEEK